MTIRDYTENNLQDFLDLAKQGRIKFAETVGIGGIEKSISDDPDYSDFTAKESMLQRAYQYAIAKKYSGFISERPILSFSTGEICHAYTKFTFFRLENKEKELNDAKANYLKETGLPDLDSNQHTQTITNTKS